MGNKRIQDIGKIDKAPDGVKIIIASKQESDLLAVQSMVESCSAGTCNCMKSEVKEKVTGMEFVRNRQGASIHIHGGISVEEIRETMERSQNEMNSGQCSSISNDNDKTVC